MRREVPIRARAASLHLIRPGAAGAEVLLMRRTTTLAGTWCQVAGRLEPGETAWQTVLREAREETGLVPDRLWYADIMEQFYVPALDVINLLPVFVGFVPMDAEVVLNHEHDAWEWLGFDAARARVSFAGQRRILDHVEAEFVGREPNPWLEVTLPK